MARDPQKKKAYNDEYRRKNLEKIKARKAEYRKENLEAIRKRGRDRYKKNKKKMLRAVKQYYQRNKERIRATTKEAHRADPRVAMYKAAQVRAKAKKMLFTLSLNDIVIPSHCPILGIPIVVGDGFRCHGSPSLDRVDPKKAYTPDNCRVISFKANTIKNDGTIEDHERVIAYMRGER